VKQNVVTCQTVPPRLLSLSFQCQQSLIISSNVTHLSLYASETCASSTRTYWRYGRLRESVL